MEIKSINRESKSTEPPCSHNHLIIILISHCVFRYFQLSLTVVNVDHLCGQGAEVGAIHSSFCSSWVGWNNKRGFNLHLGSSRPSSSSSPVDGNDDDPSISIRFFLLMNRRRLTSETSNLSEGFSGDFPTP